MFLLSAQCPSILCGFGKFRASRSLSERGGGVPAATAGIDLSSSLRLLISSAPMDSRGTGWYRHEQTFARDDRPVCCHPSPLATIERIQIVSSILSLHAFPRDFRATLPSCTSRKSPSLRSYPGMDGFSRRRDCDSNSRQTRSKLMTFFLHLRRICGRLETPSRTPGLLSQAYRTMTRAHARRSWSD